MPLKTIIETWLGDILVKRRKQIENFNKELLKIKQNKQSIKCPLDVIDFMLFMNLKIKKLLKNYLSLIH